MKMMTESNKIRIETSLETLDAVLSAIRVTKRWVTFYPDELTTVEEQSLKELGIHLDKAESTVRNLMSTFHYD